FGTWVLYIRPSIALPSERSPSGRTSSTICRPGNAICCSASGARPERRRPMEAPCGTRSNPRAWRNRWSFSSNLRSSMFPNVRKVTATKSHVVIGVPYRLIHFATARKAFNIAFAAVDGHGGEPGSYRNYRLPPIRQAAATQPQKGRHHQTMEAPHGNYEHPYTRCLQRSFNPRHTGD